MLNRRRLSIAASAVAATLAVATPMAVAGTPASNGGSGGANADAPAAARSVDRASALVVLQGAPLSTSARTRPAQGKKINFSSRAVRNYRAHLAAQRNAFKTWLGDNAPKARITGAHDLALNAVSVKLNGTPLSRLAGAPGVRTAQYDALYQPTDDNDPDLDLINAQDAWRAASTEGAADAGRGVKVAIIDTGIDVTHPCFDDAGFPAEHQLGDKRFTNNKVIVAKVFYNKAAVNGLTPEAVQEHGTHVAGTVACDLDTPVTVDGVEVPYDMSGVAPAAVLGNYNIFPGGVENARSEDIVDALEAAYRDGFDVANMSLGGSASGNQDLLAMAVDNLDRANMVVAVAAGNSGPGHYTVESPGSAARALSAGASTVGHFVGSMLAFDEGEHAGLASGDFATVEQDLTAPLGVVPGSTGGLGDACSALDAPLTGQIAVLSRGTCSFSTKIRNAQVAGAVAAVVVNNVAGDPTAMAQDGTADQPTIPAYMASLADRDALVRADDGDATIPTEQSYVRSTNDDIMAGFSSQGPTDVSFRVKPDVVAPGVNVLSSIPHSFCEDPPCFAFFQGTSMATPHLAGSAAVVLGANPDWSAEQVRSAIVNTAQQGVLTDYQTGTEVVTDVNIVGAGLEDLLSAVGADVALGPVSISFGAVPSGAGQTQASVVRVTNLGDAPATFSAAVDSVEGAGVDFTASQEQIKLEPQQTGRFTVTMVASKRAAAGDHQAMLRVYSGGEEVAHAAVYALVK